MPFPSTPEPTSPTNTSSTAISNDDNAIPGLYTYYPVYDGGHTGVADRPPTPRPPLFRPGSPTGRQADRRGDEGTIPGGRPGLPRHTRPQRHLDSVGEGGQGSGRTTQEAGGRTTEPAGTVQTNIFDDMVLVAGLIFAVAQRLRDRERDRLASAALRPPARSDSNDSYFLAPVAPVIVPQPTRPIHSDLLHTILPTTIPDHARKRARSPEPAYIQSVAERVKRQRRTSPERGERCTLGRPGHEEVGEDVGGDADSEGSDSDEEDELWDSDGEEVLALQE